MVYQVFYCEKYAKIIDLDENTAGILPEHMARVKSLKYFQKDKPLSID